MAHARRLPILVLVSCLTAVAAPRAQTTPRPTLAPADIDAIAQLVMLEDTRAFDEAAFAKLLAWPHHEVRRRAIVALARIVKPGGAALLATLRNERDPTLLAAVVFATGQHKDPAAIGWLGDLLMSSANPPGVAREAARSLGKYTPLLDARAVLARYLAAAAEPRTPAAADIISEALYSIGRFAQPATPPAAAGAPAATGAAPATPPAPPAPLDIAPIVRWATSSNVEIRWRAGWALMRSRTPAAVPHLLRLTQDPSPDVRFWTARGLVPALVDAAGVNRFAASARLRTLTQDQDRRVRTEALRALGQYDDDASFEIVMTSLALPDSWIAVSAAEALARFRDRAAVVAPRLEDTIKASGNTALRVTALNSLAAIAPERAIESAVLLIKSGDPYAKTAAIAALTGRVLGDPGRARLAALAADPSTSGLLPPPAPPRPARTTPAPRTLDEYRALVTKWIVPDYTGAPKPHAILETPRGSIEVELYPGDAPLGMEQFEGLVATGAIVGTAFTRVVPNFVAQQGPIRDASTLRDEVSQRGLVAGNLSWASSGLDTGRPGYTMGSTPQPHNEGNFTSLGRVVSGLDVVDRLELGDTITAARLLPMRSFLRDPGK